jgi:hypothetical protein
LNIFLKVLNRFKIFQIEPNKVPNLLIIHYLIYHFILKHTKFTIYYSDRNGQVKFTNKIYGTLFTKLVNGNQNDGMNTCSQFYFRIKLFLKWNQSHSISTCSQITPIVTYKVPFTIHVKIDPWPKTCQSFN